MPREIMQHRSGLDDLNNYIRVETWDDPKPGDPNNLYRFLVKGLDKMWQETGSPLRFQSGPINKPSRENPSPSAPNGLSIEAVLVVLIDRLQGFQKGHFPCRENSIAITHLETALHWLHARTVERTLREVENKKTA